RILQVEGAFESTESEAERIRVADLRPQPHAGAAKGPATRRAQQPDFRPLAGRLLEPRRLHERAQLVQLGARLECPQRQHRDDQSRYHQVLVRTARYWPVDSVEQ